jgi:hypothetical protein
MKIELKNVKHSEFASHETNCFEASVYIDGVRAGIVENDGQGGCNRYHPYELEIKINDYAKTLPPVVTSMTDPHDSSKTFTYDQDADTVINDLLTNHLYAKDLKRALAKKILYVKDDGRLYESKITIPVDLSTPEKQRSLLDMFKTRAKAIQVLNVMPFGEALSIYRAGGTHV